MLGERGNGPGDQDGEERCEQEPGKEAHAAITPLQIGPAGGPDVEEEVAARYGDQQERDEVPWSGERPQLTSTVPVQGVRRSA